MLLYDGQFFPLVIVVGWRLIPDNFCVVIVVVPFVRVASITKTINLQTKYFTIYFTLLLQINRGTCSNSCNSLWCIWYWYKNIQNKIFIRIFLSFVYIRNEQSVLVGREEIIGWLVGATTVIGVACRTWPTWFRNVTGFWPSLETWTS